MNQKTIFITGIPTGGKSYLAKKLGKDIGAEVISIDRLREEMCKDPAYEKWVNFYINKDEKEYYTKTSPEEQWQHLVDQCEGIWPFILDKINSLADLDKPVIFQGVNILPHLAKRDLSFSGIVLIGKSRQNVFDRIKQRNRWGNTEELWNLEADSFFNIERPRYKAEAEKYGYEVFETADEAYDTAVKLLTT